MATEDIFGQWLSATERALSVAANAGSDSLTISAGGFQVINPQFGDRNGLSITQIQAQLNDDDMTFTFA